MESRKRGRPPEADNTPKRARVTTAAATTVSVNLEPPLAATGGSVVDPPAPSRFRSNGWVVLSHRLQEVARQLRVVLFVHIPDERKLFRARRHLKVLAWRLAWIVIVRLREPAIEVTDDDVSLMLAELGTCSFAELSDHLLALYKLVLEGRVNEAQPLLSKLPPHRRQQLEDVLGRDVRLALANQGPRRDGLQCSTWFTMRTTPSVVPSQRTLQDLTAFQHTTEWPTSAADHARKVLAYDTKHDRALQMIECKKDLAMLTKGQVRDETAVSRVRATLKALKKEEALVLCRARKYRLLPTPEQRRTLLRFMGTCRWTYNRAVEHYYKTGVSNAITLASLYVTKRTKKPRVFPDGMKPPPAWVYKTPDDIRNQTMRTFQANVSSAITNLKKHHIVRFSIRYKGKFVNPMRTFAVSGMFASIESVDEGPRPLLSIPKLKGIPICCDRDVQVTSQIQITVQHGYFYAIIPQYARPSPPELYGRCIALDPGLRTFQTGVDLDGTVVEIGRYTVNAKTNEEQPARTHLQQLESRASMAQHDMVVVRSAHGHRTEKEWKAYAQAKRTFHSATAKLSNCVKDLHHRACSFLTKNYDIIILPIFRSKEMVRSSMPRTHGFNRSLLGLKHYQFRKLLEAKCAVMGKTLVVCSEMYSSMTCGVCSRLHPGLGSSEVFLCPHCHHTAGRDVNAAFNILRFVVGASLQTFEVHR